MFCKRMHLTERRYKPPPEIKEGPTIRSDIIVDDEHEIPSPRLKRSVNGPAATILSSTSTTHEKTPLIVITLSIPPEVPTLVPKIIKRYPRKPPSFCQQYMTTTTIRQTLENQQQQQQQQNNNMKKLDLPDICIRGVLLGPSSIENNNKIDGIIYETKDENLHCDLPIDHHYQQHDGLFGINLNLDGYEMDNFGHLPGDSKTPTPRHINCMQRRTSSPTTGQVIRVDVSLNQKSTVTGVIGQNNHSKK